MTSNDHADIHDLIPAFALGCLDSNEKADVARHLKSCASCRVELENFERVTDALALAAPAAVPSPALRGRLMDEARAHNGKRFARGIGHSPSAPGKDAGRSLSPARRAWPALALVGLVALVLGGLLWAAFGRSTWLPGGRAAVVLSPTDNAPGASGELRFKRGGEAALVVTGLPTLPAEQQYQLWLVHGEERDSGAVFSVDTNGWAEVPIILSRPAADYDRFGITVEPAGGSPGPTGDGVLRSQ